jgi:hypothetical protein
MSETEAGTLRVAIFDDVLAARREVFHIPGLEVGVYGDADDVCLICSGANAPDVVCMDYAMGPQHANGADAIRAVRTVGFAGKIVAMSSDPAANAAMIQAGANESLLQKSMLRSYLVALGAGKIDAGVGATSGASAAAGASGAASGDEKGSIALPALSMVGALAAMVAGVLLVGPLGHSSRYHGDLVRMAARVVPQGSPESSIDHAPAPVEAVAVWGAKDKAFQMVAGDESFGDARFLVAAGGRRWIVDAGRQTVWHVSPGPSRRVSTPSDVPAGANVPGFAGVRYVARSQRVVEGEYLWIVGILPAMVRRGDLPVLHASEIPDEDHVSVLGPEVVGNPAMQGGGLALLGLSALLLAGASRS